MKTAAFRFAILLAGLLAAGAAGAQRMERDKRWDFTLQMHNVEGKNYAFEGGSTAQTSNSLGFGIGIAYNMNNHLNLGMDFSWVNMDYNATVVPVAGSGQTAFSGRGSADMSSAMFNATWHFLSGPFTPYVAGGIGGTYIDTNIQTGPAVPVCWYYPWYGYYCGTAVPTASNNYFSYSGGAGVRWDFSPGVFMRAGGTRLWVDASDYSGNSGTTTWRIDIGFRN